MGWANFVFGEASLYIFLHGLLLLLLRGGGMLMDGCAGVLLFDIFMQLLGTDGARECSWTALAADAHVAAPRRCVELKAALIRIDQLLMQ